MRVSQKNESIKGISYIREGVNRGEEKERERERERGRK